MRHFTCHHLLGPIELVDGVPFLITRGYSLGGKAELGKDYLKYYCMKECDWNTAAFKTVSPKDKQAALAKLLVSTKWKGRLSDEDKKFLAEQIKSADDAIDPAAVSAVMGSTTNKNR